MGTKNYPKTVDEAIALPLRDVPEIPGGNMTRTLAPGIPGDGIIAFIEEGRVMRVAWDNEWVKVIA